MAYEGNYLGGARAGSSTYYVNDVEVLVDVGRTSRNDKTPVAPHRARPIELSTDTLSTLPRGAEVPQVIERRDRQDDEYGSDRACTEGVSGTECARPEKDGALRFCV